jgi:site-specific DNA-methyltransferase (adenine-specific)
MSDIQLINTDCLPYMKQCSDKQFDLAICDPPYGIGEDGGKFRDRKGGGHRVLPKKNWDSKIPSKEYFKELKRISRNQIIWGGNYFVENLKNSRGWIYWRKLMGGDFADGELAWTSFDRVIREFTFCNKLKGHIHPTEKPVELYKWLLHNYAKAGDKIIDTHGGSMSIAIACHDYKFDLVVCEIDKEYYEVGKKRLEDHQKQLVLF